VAFRVVLDACVLYPFSLRDTLLRLAECELYDLYWSDRILDETTRNLVENGVMAQSAADRLETAMREAFDGSVVPALAIGQLEAAMTNHPKDRHVLAAAVAAHAEAIVTVNLRDFADEACVPLNVSATHPDDFLQVLWAKRPETVRAALRAQAADLTDPPWTLDQLLDSLAVTVPRFVDSIRGK
jgi:predicted nucleic acid-binding protein